MCDDTYCPRDIMYYSFFLMQEGGRYSWVPLVEKQSQLPPGRYINMWDAGLRRHPRIGETFNYHISGHSLMHEKGRELKEKNGFLLSSIPFISMQDDWMDLY